MDNKRLLSIDALRGFDMMFIMGFATILSATCMLFPGGKECWLNAQMSHVAWDGLRHHDTIFPLFLFISGLTFPFSLAARKAKGMSNKRIFWKTVLRGLVLCLLGLVYNRIFELNPHFRIPSVLARIGLAWMFALFHWLIDVKGWKKWTPFFTVIGMNSITIYMLQRIVSFKDITAFFLGGAAGLMPKEWGSWLLAIGYFAISWLLLWFLYRKKIFLKV